MDIITQNGGITYNPHYWNHPNNIRRLVCINYGLHFTKASVTYDSFLKNSSLFGLPKPLVENNIHKDWQRPDEFKDILIASGFPHLPMKSRKSFPIPEAGSFLSAAFLRNNRFDPDYHFFRMNLDGTFSHKVATGAASLLDNDDKRITDPRTCNVGSYTIFVGFFGVNLSMQLERASRIENPEKYTYSCRL